MLRRLAIALALLALPSTARAIEFRLLSQPLRLDVTESLYLNYHADPGNGDPSSANYGEILNRLNAQLAWRRFLFGFRIDTAAYVHTPQIGDQSIKANCPKVNPPPGCIGTVKASDLLTQGRFARFENHYVDPRKLFEKVFLAYSGRSVDVTLGDSYVNFGRGLVLSIRKVDELGVDTSLEGLKVAVHEGDLSAVAVAGWTNIQNIDEASATYTPDYYTGKSTSPLGDQDFVAGAHADYRFGGLITVGGHAVLGLPALDKSALSKQHDYYLRYGVTFDAPRVLPWLALYLEYARGDDRVTGTGRIGNAVYGAATAYLGRTTLLLEYKDYRNYLPWHATNDPFGSLVYMQPPTLERVQTQINNNTDIVSARVRADVQVRPWLSVYGSLQVGQSQPAPDTTDSLYDAYGGAQVRWNDGRSHLFPLLGYRFEHDDTHNTVEEQLVAVEIDGTQALPRSFSLELQGLVWFRKKGDEIVAGSGDNQWREGNVYLSLKWAPRFILAAGYEFTTIAQEQLNKHDFFNGSLQWNITSSTSLRLFAGGQRPGLKCISGVCRVFPAFNGAKLELVVRL